MAKFRQRANLVEAVQLLWSTWNEMCAFTGVGTGCYVNPSGCETEDTNGRIGLKVPGQIELAVEGDWIVRDENGVLHAYTPNAFAGTFEPAEDPNKRESVDFEPDWRKYPKLAAVFKHRPVENLYWEELRGLIADAQADAVRYVHDVRADELAKARADERARIKKG